MAQKVKSQCVSFLLTFVMISMLRGILGYIGASIFAPIWRRILIFLGFKK